jgi:hypothetical protein
MAAKKNAHRAYGKSSVRRVKTKGGGHKQVRVRRFK